MRATNTTTTSEKTGHTIGTAEITSDWIKGNTWQTSTKSTPTDTLQKFTIIPNTATYNYRH